jgi:4'-phosphopantetheinyl transferase
MDLMASRFFSLRENAILRELPPAQRMIAFYHAWTRKEAILKAYGEGISEVLDSVEVTLAPDEAAELLGIRGSEEEAARWSLAALDAPHKFAAALAVEGNEVQIVHHTIA